MHAKIGPLSMYAEKIAIGTGKRSCQLAILEVKGNVGGARVWRS